MSWKEQKSPIEHFNLSTLSRDGKLMAFLTGKQLTICDSDFKNIKNIKLEIHARMTAMDISPDNQLIVIGCESCACMRCHNDPYIYVINMADGKIIQKFDHKSTNPVCALKFTKDGKFVVASFQKYIQVYEMATEQLFAEHKNLPYDYRGVIFQKDDDNDDTFYVARYDETLCRDENGHANDWKKLKIVVNRYQILERKTETLKPTLFKEYSFPFYQCQLAISPNNRYLAASGSETYIYDMQSPVLEPILKFECSGPSVRSLGFSFGAHAKYLVTGCFGYCEIWDLIKGERVALFKKTRVSTDGRYKCLDGLSQHCDVFITPNEQILTTTDTSSTLIVLEDN